MAKDPAVLFYTSDFLSGTSFFTDEQKGQYITLLCQQHQLGSIPENHMIFICKSYDSPVMKKFVKDESGNYYNVRMREEGEKRANYCSSRGNNKKGHYKDINKDNHMKIISKSYENHMENIDRNEVANTTKTSKRTTKTSTINKDFEEVWINYPNKLGKNAAQRHFKATVITPEDYQDICTALDNYIEYCKKIEPKFIKHGSTWFNNWKDWISYEAPKTEVTRMEEEKELMKKLGIG